MTVNFEKIKQQVERAAEKWLKDQADMEIHVYRMLNEGLEQIVKEAIGFKRDSWRGAWEINVANNINAYSKIGKEVWVQAEAHAKRIVAELVAEYEVTFDAAEKSKMQTYYRAAVKKALNNQLEERAQLEAEQLLDQVIGMVWSENSVDDQIKLKVNDLSEEKKLAILKLIEEEDEE